MRSDARSAWGRFGCDEPRPPPCALLIERCSRSHLLAAAAHVEHSGNDCSSGSDEPSKKPLWVDICRWLYGCNRPKAVGRGSGSKRSCRKPRRVPRQAAKVRSPRSMPTKIGCLSCLSDAAHLTKASGRSKCWITTDSWVTGTMGGINGRSVLGLINVRPHGRSHWSFGPT
jgi:hypothetical protein